MLWTDASELVTVGAVSGHGGAQLALGALEAAGIEALMQGENANSLYPGAFGCRVLVAKADEEAAKELLASDGSAEAAAGEAAGEDWGSVSRAKAVVCLSGGMDSTVCASLAARDYEAMGCTSAMGSGRRHGS